MNSIDQASLNIFGHSFTIPTEKIHYPEKVYIIGALKNQEIPNIANKISGAGHKVFADWFSPGKDADTEWQKYENVRGRKYRDAIYGPHAVHCFAFDKKHLDECSVGVLVMPAGRSGHLELGYLSGRGKRTYILFDGEPERFDLMYLFADYVCFSVEELIQEIDNPRKVERNWEKVSGFD